MVVLDRILCPIDLSDVSRHALRHAAAIARWYDAQLTALYVIPPPYVPPIMAPAELLSVPLPPEGGLQQLRDQVNGWLAELGSGLRTEAVVDQGPVAWRILERAASMAVDLLVMGTHGHGGFDRLMLGSVAEKVLRKAQCPVMTVPPPSAPAPLQPFKRLLCAVDFSATSSSALRYALAIAREADARVVILHVIEWPPLDDGMGTDSELAEYHALREARAKRILAALVTDDERTWCEPVTLLEHGRPWQTIVGVAEREHSDLIVMGVHGRKMVGLALFGSTTNQVVRHAPCPVLTLRK